MSLLALERVAKAYDNGTRRTVVLADISLELEAGETAGVWGVRRSGRTTLLRVAAGVIRPDAGVVRFAGRDLQDPRHDALGVEIGYCRTSFRPSEGPLVVDHLSIGLLARGITLDDATRRAHRTLERVDAGPCAGMRPGELDPAERMRVAIARSIVLQPQILLIDEPTIGLDQAARDELQKLIASLAADGLGVLLTTGETPVLAGTRALALSDGELKGVQQEGEMAPVVPLRRLA